MIFLASFWSFVSIAAPFDMAGMDFCYSSSRRIQTVIQSIVVCPEKADNQYRGRHCTSLPPIGFSALTYRHLAGSAIS